MTSGTHPSLWPVVVWGAVLVAPARGAVAQEAEAWRPIAAKLQSFLPEPVPGLVDHLPWDAPGKPEAEGLPCAFMGQCQELFQVHVRRVWAIDDPTLFRQYAAADSQKSALLESLKRGAPQEEVNRVMEQLKKIPSTDSLKRLGRTLQVEIETNTVPEWYEAPQIGMIKGHPLYGRGERTYVFVGPAGFKNPRVQKPTDRLDVKAILVNTWLSGSLKQSDPNLARRMLEALDYAGLEKLLQP